MPDVPGPWGPKVDARAPLARDRAALLDLLRELTPDQWRAPTAAAPWMVRDLVAHLLGDDVNRLGRTRDGHGVGPLPGEALPGFIHRINNEWVAATVRLSPAVLVSLLETTGREVSAMWHDLDLDALGEPVTWTGPDPAPIWLDCARDFTEYWVHQRQVREAVGRPGHPDPGLLRTALDVLLRAVPHTLAGAGRPGDTLAIEAHGAADLRWAWANGAGTWRPTDAGAPRPAATLIRLDADTLWRLCARMAEPAEARRQAQVTGDERLANAALQVVSIIR